jgi:hypothetical protein
LRAGLRTTALLTCLSVGPLAGCNLAYYTAYNLKNKTHQRVDEHHLSKRLRAEAQAAFGEVCRQYPGQPFTEEFRDGFTEGYVDYLEHGGLVQPPAAPPPRYRRNDYLSPEGHALIKDYFAGFQYGAEVALATGRREFLTIPILLPNPKPEQPLDIRIPAPPGVAPVGPVEPAPAPTGPVLPPAAAPVVPPPGPPPAPVPGVPPGLGNPVPPKSDGAIPPKPDVPQPDPPKGDRPKPVSVRVEPYAPPVAPPPAQPALPDRPPTGRPPVARPPAAFPAAPNPK